MEGRKKALQNATLRGLRRDSTKGFFHGEGCCHCLNQPFHAGRTCTNKDEMCTGSLASGLAVLASWPELQITF